MSRIDEICSYHDLKAPWSFCAEKVELATYNEVLNTEASDLTVDEHTFWPCQETGESMWRPIKEQIEAALPTEP